MFTFGGLDPSNGAGLNLGVLNVLVNVMIYGSFGLERSRDFRAARDPFQHIAIGLRTRTS